VPKRVHRRLYTLPPRRAPELRFVAIRLEQGRQRSANRGLSEILVVSAGKTKYNKPMNRSAYSYWFRFWYPPI